MEGGKSRIFGIVLFIVIGASALVLGAIQTGKSIKKPFEPDPEAVARMQQVIETQNVDTNKDTDGDGLTDYQEANTYQTSPYIKDTDSDGLADGEEVRNGTDPVCPEGKDCYGRADDNTNAALNVNVGEDIIPIDLEALTIDQTAITAQEIREMLKEQGVSDEILNAFDDASILQLYSESLENISNTETLP